LTVANVTTPANYFHLLRRQMIRNYRRPLVLASPKILLRHPHAVSPLTAMGPGTSFQSVLPDPQSYEQTKTIALVSGKLYYDLATERATLKRNDIALVRVEELSPFPFARLTEELKRISSTTKNKITRIVWCQEEPQNAGAWSFVAPRLQTVIKQSGLSTAVPSVSLISRPPLPLPVCLPLRFSYRNSLLLPSTRRLIVVTCLLGGWKWCGSQSTGSTCYEEFVCSSIKPELLFI
jgi:2-oxoglutarate dehydrogenase complex dehydrogenase (E1) component-like enzyme